MQENQPGRCIGNAPTYCTHYATQYFNFGVFRRYSTVVGPSANLVVTLDKKPILATFVVLTVRYHVKPDTISV